MGADAVAGVVYAGRPFYLDGFRYANNLANDQSDRLVADLRRPGSEK